MRAAIDWVRRAVVRRPFLSLGILTFTALLAVEAFAMPPALRGVLRVIIVPLWLMRTLEMVVGVGSLPGAIQLVVALPALFLPYAAADWLLWRARRRWDSGRRGAI